MGKQITHSTLILAFLKYTHKISLFALKFFLHPKKGEIDGSSYILAMKK